MLLSVELCSLMLQRDDLSVANIVASGLFGDGAAAVVLTGAERGDDGPRVVATRSIFYPDTERVMGWDVVASGFKVVLTAQVPDIVRRHVGHDVDAFLHEHGLSRSDVRHWIAHTGGPKVLEAFQAALGLPDGALLPGYSGIRPKTAGQKMGAAITQLGKNGFQAVYFGNVASHYRGEDIFQLRRRLGMALTRLYGRPEADVVIPNPDSGRGVSYGIAEGLGMPISHGLVKQAQAIRTFQESQVRRRTIEVGLKFAAIDSVLCGRRVVMGDDSIVKGSVSEGGSVWSVYNAGAKRLEFWISYGPMFFPSFKEWRRGRECLDELAVQRAFRGEHPYDKPLEEINRRVARLIGVDRVCYNTRENVEAVTGYISVSN